MCGDVDVLEDLCGRMWMGYFGRLKYVDGGRSGGWLLGWGGRMDVWVYGWMWGWRGKMKDRVLLILFD